MDALDYCHKNQVVHRDVKPANIIVTVDRKVFLVDFGIARPNNPLGAQSRSVQIISAGYSPPEQYAPGPTEVRCDVYSVGATMYHLLTGRAPLDAPRRGAGQELPLPRAPTGAILPSVSAAIMKALELRVDRRFQTIDEFRHALGRKAGGRRRMHLWLYLAFALLFGTSLVLRRDAPIAELTQAFFPGPLRSTATEEVTTVPPPPKTVASTRVILGPPAPPQIPATPVPTAPDLSANADNSTSVPTPLPILRPSATSTPIPTITPSLTPIPSPTITPTPTPYVRVSGDNVNLRSGPSTNCAVMGRVARGDVLAVIGRDPSGKWWQARTQAGIEARISGSLAPATGAELVPIRAVTPCPPRLAATPVPTSNIESRTVPPPRSVSGACPHPGSCIVDPRDNETILGVTAVRGRATCPNFQRYKVEYLPEGGTNWGVLRERYQSVEASDGLLMEWYTGTVPPGAYSLRLTVVDRTGNYLPQAIIRVVVIR